MSTQSVTCLFRFLRADYNFFVLVFRQTIKLLRTGKGIETEEQHSLKVTQIHITVLNKIHLLPPFYSLASLLL